MENPSSSLEEILHVRSRTSRTTSSTCHGLSRRHFIARAGAAASWSVLKPNLAHGYAANSKVKIGLIGCGGRGAWIADLFQQHGGYELVAVADYFQDRVDAAGDKLNVAAAQRFTGLAGYRTTAGTEPGCGRDRVSALFPSRAGSGGRGRG